MSIEPLEVRLTPATFVVIGLGDAGQGFGNTGDLRYCINQANGSKDTSNTIDMGMSGTISLTSQLPTITNNVAIVAGTATSITIQGNGNAGNGYRIFVINQGATVSINNLGIKFGYDTSGDGGGGILNDGNLTLQGDYVVDNYTTGSGGGVYNGSGATLTLTSTDLNVNTAQQSGGGLANVGGTVNVCCQSSILSNKALTGSGGGIYNIGLDAQAATINCYDDTWISGNTAAASGGGVANSKNATFSMNSGYIQGNSANTGGGLYNGNGGTVELSNGVSVSSQNTAANFGGGIYIAAGSTMTPLDNVTVQNNKLTANGGKGVGIYWQNGSDNLTYTDLTDNDDPGGVPVQGN